MIHFEPLNAKPLGEIEWFENVLYVSLWAFCEELNNSKYVLYVSFRAQKSLTKATKSHLKNGPDWNVSAKNTRSNIYGPVADNERSLGTKYTDQAITGPYISDSVS